MYAIIEDGGRQHKVTTGDRVKIDRMFANARAAQPAWDAAGGATRAKLLNAVADAIEAALPSLVALLTREAGKTFADSRRNYLMTRFDQ